jgi:CheY-like chemotaxis protein
VPLNVVARVVAADEVRSGERDGGETLMLKDGVIVPVIQLARRLGLAEAETTQVMLVRVGEQHCALRVDRVDPQQDIVAKPLGALLNRHPFFSGATITEEGRIVFIVDVARLAAAGPMAPRSVTAPLAVAGAVTADRRRVRRVLVVDDSLSLRLLMTRQVEALGCQVTTAVDGREALAHLAAGGFDLVISDLEMPRMNGLELLREMQADVRWQGLPRIVVTTRDSAEFRAQARALGARDYLIKPISRPRLAAVVRALLAARENDNGGGAADADCAPASAGQQTIL